MRDDIPNSTNIANADMDGDAQAAVKKSGSSMLIKQTGYDDGDSVDTHPVTYLQLGAYPSFGDDAERGDDLLAMVGLTTSTTAFFKDDHRHANSQTATDTVYQRDDGNVQATKTPVQLTSELMTRGGFRLHTDGNYVSTTRGDRVDVIFGNHHLSVLGRTGGSSTADVWRPAEWESSGGHTVKDDVARRSRITQVAWDSNRSAYKTYINTLKANHKRRFQGPLETVHKGDVYKETIGRDPTLAAGTIPATSAEPHEQTDAATKWVNPSVGAGTNWPQPFANPAWTENISAKKVTTKVKVRSSLGSRSSNSAPKAGSISESAAISTSLSKTVSAKTIEDKIYASKDAKVYEANGFDSALTGSSGVYTSNLQWRMTLSLGEMRTTTFVKREDRIVCDIAKWNQGAVHVDIIGLQMNAQLGIKVEATDLGRVPMPSWTMKGFWNGDSWDSAIGTVYTMFWFGHTITEYRKVVSTTEVFFGARASLSASYLKMRWGMDYLDVHPVGSRLEASLFKAIGALVSMKSRLLEQELASFKYSLSGIKAKS